MRGSHPGKVPGVDAIQAARPLVVINRLDRRVIWIGEDVGPEASFLLGFALVADERAEEAARVFQLPAGQARAAWTGLHGVVSLLLSGWHADARPKHWRR